MTITPTPEVIREMLEGTTPGDWDCSGETVFALDQTGTVNRFSFNVQGGFVVRQQGWDNPERTDDAELQANASLAAAAPSLARAYLALSERVGELEKAISDARFHLADLVGKGLSSVDRADAALSAGDK